MLHSLRVRDLATIADVSLELTPGLNVLTGETGAGKSLLFDALSLLLGDRADRAAIRNGQSRCIVEGVFNDVDAVVGEFLQERGLDRAESLVIRREVNLEGRSRGWINGSPTTMAVLGEIGALLVDLHGQHQSLALSHAAGQRQLLDAWSGAEAARQAVAVAFHSLESLQQRRVELIGHRDEATRQLDWLQHVVAEIDAARLRLGEDEELQHESSLLSQAGVIASEASELLELLEGDAGGVRDVLAHAGRVIDRLARRDPAVGEWRNLLDSAWAGLDELARNVAAYADDISSDPERLDRVEHRRELIAKLTARHGGSIEAVLATRHEAAAEIDLVDRSRLDLAELDSEVVAASSLLATAAERLSSQRQQGATRLAGEVTRLLPKLGLSGAAMTVELMPLVAVGPDGCERPRFEARLNEGMGTRPIASAASGGELARLMLAIKTALVRQDPVPTLFFDEVDQGIGGETAGRVGRALASLAERHQTVVVTHLPQIAALADHHLVVHKGTRDGIASSDVAVLHGEDRVIELARMLGNPDDAAARRLALSLMGGNVSG